MYSKRRKKKYKAFICASMKSDEVVASTWIKLRLKHTISKCMTITNVANLHLAHFSYLLLTFWHVLFVAFFLLLLLLVPSFSFDYWTRNIHGTHYSSTCVKMNEWICQSFIQRNIQITKATLMTNMRNYKLESQVFGLNTLFGAWSNVRCIISIGKEWFGWMNSKKKKRRKKRTDETKRKFKISILVNCFLAKRCSSFAFYFM